MERQKARGGIVAERRSGGNGMDESNGRHDGDGRPDESAEHDSLPILPWPHTRATRYTITPIPDIPPGPGRAREVTLRAGARDTFRHAVSRTASASFAEVRARAVKRPEKRSLRS